MSNTQLVLDVLKDGYYTTEHIAETTKLTDEQVSSVLSELLAEGVILILHGGKRKVVARRPTIG